MRWTRPAAHEYADLRLRTAFLWLPMTIGQETRWLERATWLERVDVYRDGVDCTPVEWRD